MKNTDYCSRCKVKGVPLIKHFKTKTTQYHWCRPCENAKAKKYQMTPAGREATRRINARQYKKHGHKWRARAKYHYALSTGKLKRPTKCEKCGASGRIEGHHDDYDKPLEVHSLCTSCHAALHAVQ